MTTFTFLKDPDFVKSNYRFFKLAKVVKDELSFANIVYKLRLKLLLLH